jgi:hypothetical protein
LLANTAGYITRSKEGLLELGHEVSIGHQDGFKNYPIDYPIKKKMG